MGVKFFAKISLSSFSIFTIVVSLLVRPTFSQTSPTGSSFSTNNVFSCIPSKDKKAYVTVYVRGNLNPIPMIIWTSQEFGTKYTPKSRCETVTSKFNKVYYEARGRLNEMNITHGRNRNGLSVICVARDSNHGCNENNILFTLRKKDIGRENDIIQKLTGITTDATSSPIMQQEGRKYVNLEQWFKHVQDKNPSISTPPEY